ncbi:hypothetical protein C1645_223255 [Glomus cerebriforme]|uniref:Uncharacterized protein n=1 Tax=Glomus cerebriforme TaxID=658196 RepID=A0A397SV61_9GLOM|nr:hypothetical protein C1645_223255 [Glomus cerebriforme]
MTFAKVMRLGEQTYRLQKRQKAPVNNNNIPKNNPPNSNVPKQTETFLQPFPTVPPVLNNNKTINSDPNLQNSSDGNISGAEMLGLAAGALVVIGLIGLFIRKKIVGDRTREVKITEYEKATEKPPRPPRPSQYLRDASNTGENSPSMINQNSPLDSPRSFSSQQTSTSYRGPSQDDDDSYLLQSSKQKELPYPPNSYRGTSKDDDLPYLPQSSSNLNSQKSPSSSQNDGLPHLPQSSLRDPSYTQSMMVYHIYHNHH